MSYEHLLFLLFFSPSNFSQLILRTTIIPCLQNNQISIFCAFFFPRVGIFCAIISIDHIEVKKYVSVLLFDCLTFDWLVVLLTLIMSWRGLQPDPSTKVFGYLFNNPFFSWLFKSEQMMNLSQVLIQVLFYFFREEHKHKEHLIRHNRQKVIYFFWMIYNAVASFVFAEKKEELKQRFITQNGNSPIREGQQKENIAIILPILREMSSSILLWTNASKFNIKKNNISTINKKEKDHWYCLRSIIQK